MNIKISPSGSRICISAKPIPSQSLEIKKKIQLKEIIHLKRNVFKTTEYDNISWLSTCRVTCHSISKGAEGSECDYLHQHEVMNNRFHNSDLKCTPPLSSLCSHMQQF